jgi:hypothetical protein
MRAKEKEEEKKEKEEKEEEEEEEEEYSITRIANARWKKKKNYLHIQYLFKGF